MLNASNTSDAVRALSRFHAPERAREEEPIGVVCDFGIVYALYLRPTRRSVTKLPRVILKMTWEEASSTADGKDGNEDREDREEDDALKSCTFEVDLHRERLVALGRKGNSISAEKFPALWFCNWARRLLTRDSE